MTTPDTPEPEADAGWMDREFTDARQQQSELPAWLRARPEADAPAPAVAAPSASQPEEVEVVLTGPPHPEERYPFATPQPEEAIPGAVEAIAAALKRLNTKEWSHRRPSHSNGNGPMIDVFVRRCGCSTTGEHREGCCVPALEAAVRAEPPREVSSD